ncbi:MULTISPECIES: hypothetical protein [Cyanophyceae]|uniref:Uncharacterized protein n=1 Tax=Leptolyngbya subtilissima DQ-A4 TaxID=2933933 RepID=A0ABV0K311_9CYAN|nr:hypothetical protein [Nodosilinea sp. FACHB-141]MBD2113080.1 hypothetical protein [Nodosilinea sp. FACHB-141]
MALTTLNIVPLTDNRNGRIFLNTNEGDPLQSSYSSGSSEQFQSLERHLSLQAGSDENHISVSLETFSSYEVEGHPPTVLRFRSKGNVEVPYGSSIQAQAIVEEWISMGFQVVNLPVGKTLAVRVSGIIDSPGSGVEVRFNGGNQSYSFESGLFSKDLNLSEGEYILTGAYNLNMIFPDADPLSSCPITLQAQVEILGVR